MNMKKIFATIAIAASLLCVSGCSDWLDINTNPNYLTDLSINDLLSAAQTNTISKVGYNMMLMGSFWSQHVIQSASANQYNSIYQNDLTFSSSYFSDVWNNFYSVSIPAYQEIIAKSEAAGDPASFVHYKIMATTLEAYDLFILTSLYGDVAYTEGNKGKENTQPKFDSESAIQATVIGLLEGVLKTPVADFESAQGLNDASHYDMIFGADANGWFQFANTIYLKVLMRDFNANKAKISTCLASSIGFLQSDAAYAHFSDAANKSNPLYESDRRQLNTPHNIRCCSDVLKLMASDDPRITDYYEIPIKGVITGGAYGSAKTNSQASRLKLSATDPVYLASIAEADFLQAEAYARLNNAAKAKECYDAGVSAAFSRWGHDASDFIADGGAYAFKAAASSEEMVHQIINQKWLAAVRCQAWDSWFDMNRTGYPVRGTDITAYSGILAKGEYPRRYLYPQRSSLYNQNTPEVIPLTDKMWWQK